jgi:hypothetical protein
MSYQKLALLLIVTFIFSPLSAGAKEAALSKRIGSTLLSIKGPAAYNSAGKKIFYDKSKSFGVKVDYGSLKVEANQVTYDPNEEVIELSSGFKGSMEQYQVKGDYFRINARTGSYAAYDLTFGYLVASLYGEKFEFYGDKIEVDNITASPLSYPVINLGTNKLEIYPGFRVFRGNTLRVFSIPLYYIPLYIEDQRRHYFELPFPAFEVESNMFHGKHTSLHSHYFFNPGLFGDVSLHSAEQDGVGLQVQQIVRLSDQQQLEIKGLKWANAPSQWSVSYRLQLFDSPRKPYQLKFADQDELEKKIAGIGPRLVLNYDYKVNEEINRSIIDRYPDVSAAMPLYGIFQDHQFTLTPTIYYGKIKEKKIFPEDTAPQDTNVDQGRVKTTIDYTYFLETPYASPFINKVLLSLDYEHSEYDPAKTNRGRLDSSVIARRPILQSLGFYYEAKLTKNLLKYGQSPFFFEEYGSLIDSGVLDLYMDANVLVLGDELIYDFTHWQAYNEIYYLGIRSGDRYVAVQYDRRMKSWRFGFMGPKEAAF